MKKKEYAINVCDTILLLLDKEKNKIYTKDCKSLKEDKIINSNLFVDEFNEFLKQNHIHISLLGWNLTIIINENENPIIIEKYKEILTDYFKNIKIKNIEEILDFENDNGYLNITKNYVDYYYIKKNKIQKLRVNPSLFNDNYQKMINHLLTTIYKPKKMTFFGTHEDVSKLSENINKSFGINITFPEYPTNYILEEYRR